MSSWDTAQLVADDKRYVWHPFTPMRDWCDPAHEPIVLVGGEGAKVWDSRGREYIDGNSSIWTNIHGHNHPEINAAIRKQLERVAHTSFLGTTNPPAIELAKKIVQLFPQDRFGRVFYSDDGSTGIEAALRITTQFWKLKGSGRRTFVAFRNGYHGDTAGAASLGAAELFGGTMGGWAAPVRVVSTVQELEALQHAEEVAGVVIEPVIQGAAGMKIWPVGTLRAVRRWCDRTGALLVADEVMTGFGRTGKMFACDHEAVMPDVMVLAKGLTGGYLPLAITLIAHEVFEPFASSEPAATLFYGHSYTGSSLGCAAGLASLEIFETQSVLASLAPKARFLREGFAAIEGATNARSVGLIGACDVPDQRSAQQVCLLARERGLLTRPIREAVILMPPLCISQQQLESSLSILQESITKIHS